LIKEQIAVGAGERLSFTQEQIVFTGHAIECRINAENPARNFLPNPGKISFLHLPGGNGIRIDSHVYQGDVIPPYYDSMIAKIISHALSRDEAIARMQRALEECVIEGVESTLEFHQAILGDAKFLKGDVSTRFLETFEWTES